MSERIDGKTFYASPQEAGVVPPTPEELDELRRVAREAIDELERVPEADLPVRDERFYDDFDETD